MFDNFAEQEKVVETEFTKFFKRKGYIIDLSDIHLLAYKADTFVPIFRLNIRCEPREFDISIDDRNGNYVLDGETAALYSLTVDRETGKLDIEKNFRALLNDAYKDYGSFNKHNRLDFVYKGLEEKYKEYNAEISDNRLKNFKEIDKFIYNNLDNFDVLGYLFYKGITDIDATVPQSELSIIIDKCEELFGDFTDPYTLANSLASEIYIEESITVNQLKDLKNESFFEWYSDDRLLGNSLSKYLDNSNELENKVERSKDMKKIAIYDHFIEYKGNEYELQCVFEDFAYYMSDTSDIGIYMDSNYLNQNVYEDKNDKIFNESMSRYFKSYDDLYESDDIDDTYGELIINKISKVKNIPIKKFDDELVNDLLESDNEEDKDLAHCIEMYR